MAAANSWNLRPTDEGQVEVHFSDSTKCRFIEFLDYGSLGAPTLNVGEIEDGTISSWFIKVFARVLHLLKFLNLCISRILLCAVTSMDTLSAPLVDNDCCQ
jgi:hypothetical protein